MVTKRDLLAMICSLEDNVCDLEMRIGKAERELKKCKPCKCTAGACKVKRKPGRPRKSEGDKLEKAIRASKQPRDKSGKFTKKH